jgi:hypothetical protein
VSAAEGGRRAVRGGEGRGGWGTLPPPGAEGRGRREKAALAA